MQLIVLVQTRPHMRSTCRIAWMIFSVKLAQQSPTAAASSRSPISSTLSASGTPTCARCLRRSIAGTLSTAIVSHVHSHRSGWCRWQWSSRGRWSSRCAWRCWPFSNKVLQNSSHRKWLLPLNTLLYFHAPTSSDIQKIIDQFDVNHDGKVSYEEFWRIALSVLITWPAVL